MNDEPRIDFFRTLVVAFVATLIVAGAWAVRRRTMAIDPVYLRRGWNNRPIPMLDLDELTYVAARPLQTNHRLTADDLKRPPIPRSIDVELPRNLIGRYVANPREPDMPIRRKDVMERPLLVVKPEKALLAFPVEATLVESGVVDVGTRMEIWNGVTLAAAGTVKAVIGSGATQRLIVEVAAKDVATIVQRPKDVVTTIVPSAGAVP